MNSRSILLFYTIIGSCFFIGHTARAAADHLVISQVQVGSYGNASDEFVEIYNPTEDDIVIDSWSLQYKSSATSTSISKKNLPSAKICKGSYFLIAHSGYDGEAVADHTQSSVSFSSNGGLVFLADGDEFLNSADSPKIIDKFIYEEVAKATAGEADKAFFRTGYSGDSFADFVFQDASPRNSSTTPCFGILPDETDEDGSSASTTPEYLTKSSNVKIYRFLPNPAGTDGGNEWVELINNDSEPILLDGWLLDDDDKGAGEPSSDAFTLSGVIQPGEIIRFLIPSTAFALNNSNGDEVNLYFGDGTLADAAPYTVAAYDDGIFEFRDGMWQPPTLPSSGGGGSLGSSSSSTSNNQATAQLAITITEFLPDPIGDDEGKIWVELYNPASSKASLSGWILDNRGTSTLPSSSAFVLDSSYSVPAKGYLVVTIPPGKFTFSGASSTIRLFKPDKSLAQSVNFFDAPEGKSYGVDEAGNWAYDFPTPGFANVFGVPLANVEVSEILPYPVAGDDEFVELYNASGTPLNLRGFRLRVGTREKVLNDALLDGNGYYVISEEDLPINLRNSGQEVVLLDNLGRELDRVVYPRSPQGQAYALSEGAFLWTSQATPGESNVMVLGAAVKAANNPSAVKPVSKPASQSGQVNYQKLYDEVVKTNQELLQRLDNLENALALLAENSVGPANAQAVDLIESNQSESPKNGSKIIYLAVAAAAAIAFVLLVWQFFRGKSV